ELPQEELFAEVECIVQGVAQHRMPRGLQSCQLLLDTVAFGRMGVNVDENAVIGVNIRRSQRFACNRHDTLALFADAFRNQLFDPEAEGVERWRRDQGELIAASLG